MDDWKRIMEDAARVLDKNNCRTQAAWVRGAGEILSVIPSEPVRASVGAENERTLRVAQAIAAELGQDYDKLHCISLNPDVLTKDDMHRAAKAAIRAYVGACVGAGADLSSEPA